MPRAGTTNDSPSAWMPVTTEARSRDDRFDQLAKFDFIKVKKTVEGANDDGAVV